MAGSDLTGIAAKYRTPGNFAEIVFAQGPSNAAGPNREVVFVMPALSTGAWAVNTLNQVRNEQDVITGGGAGSPLHRGIRKFLRNNKSARLWALPVAETTGGSPAKATSVLTIATNASSTGTLSVWVAGQLSQHTFASGDTPTQIGDGIAASINAKTYLPVTAANAAGTVTITAKLFGISQGTASLGVITTHTSITAGVGTTAAMGGAALGLGTGAAGAEGTTTEAANLATALTVIDAVRKYYIVTSANDATSFSNIKSHVTLKSEPKQGLRSIAIGAYTGSLGTGQTLSTTLNYERIDIALAPFVQNDSAEVAGFVAAIRQKEEARDVSFNFNSYKADLTPPVDSVNWLDANDIEDAIIDGLTPISSADDGCRIVHSVTTRSKDATGVFDDSRASRTLKVSVADAFTDDLLVRYALNFQGKKFKDDERLADGSVNTNQKVIPNVVRPSQISQVISGTVDDYEDEHLQEVTAIKESISVERHDGNKGRAAASLDLHVIDWLDQITTRVAEVSEG